ncbi:hypothetical protein HU200_005052 [Digitaria exilis]|uniref:F-box domain-containing protein n=1 Tax=Digitaria exilis TaxID=1010633 RepID=A0A835FRJ5_9POAL|nr:hypothetical protein HU200_005052 [Digitaria exilis]
MATSPDRKTPRPSSPTAPTERDWASLPLDILISVFHKLGLREVLLSAERTCTAWRLAAVDPTMWRRIDAGTLSPCSPGGRAIVRAALDRADGECEAFSGPCDNHLLFDLVQIAPLVKVLHLKHFYAPNKVLNLVLNRLVLLEDLEISPSYVSTGSENLLQSVCQDCPGLKKLRLNCSESFDYVNWNGVILEKIHGRIIPMPELRSLELFHCELTTQGLTAILDSCPLLETLHVTGFLVGGKMNQQLWERCAQVKDLSLPDQSVKYGRLPGLRTGPVTRKVCGPWEIVR